MATPSFIHKGSTSLIKTLENTPVTLDIYATCKKATKEKLANLALALSVTSAYEEQESYVNHVFGHRLVPDGGLSYTLVAVETQDNQLCNHYRVTVTPLRERYGAAEISIVILDYNQEEREQSDPFMGGVSIYWRRVDDSPRITDIQDVVLQKDRKSRLFEFTVTDEESDSKDLIVGMTPTNPALFQSITPCAPTQPTKNGTIRPGWTYLVQGGKELLYSSTVYPAGETFKGTKNFRSWEKSPNSTGEEEVYELDGPTRAFQITPTPGMTGVSEVEVSVADRMAVDFYGNIRYLNNVRQNKVIYDGEGFWSANIQGYSFITPDRYKSVNEWGQISIASGTNNLDVCTGPTNRGQMLVMCGVDVITFSGEDGDPDEYVDCGVILENTLEALKDNKAALNYIYKDKNGEYFYGVTFYGVCYGSGVSPETTRFLAVGTKVDETGTHGCIYRSVDAIHWELDALLEEEATFKCVTYADGVFVVAGNKPGYGEIIYYCNKYDATGKGIWTPLNTQRKTAVFATDASSPSRYIYDVTSLTYLKGTFILTGEVMKKVCYQGTYYYIFDREATCILSGTTSGISWDLKYIDWGRGPLAGLANTGEYVLGVGGNYTAVLITPELEVYNQWYTNKDNIITSPYVLNSVTFGDGMIFGVGDNGYGFISTTSIRLTRQRFIVTVTDWWESLDFLPSAIREHPLYAKTAELLDYLVANNHIQNMIKVDNLYEGKSIHFDETYLTNLLTDDSFKALDIAQENMETLAVIASNIYNIKGTVRGLKYMLSLLSAGGQKLDADVFDWVYVNQNLEKFRLAAPLDACTVLVQAKVPINLHLTDEVENRLVEIMRSFFWICANIVFNWTRTISTEVIFHDAFQADSTFPPFSDSWAYGRPYDIFKYDDLEVWKDIFFPASTSLVVPQLDLWISTSFVVKDDITIYDGHKMWDSWLDTQGSWQDSLFEIATQFVDDFYNPESASARWQDSFNWVEAEVEWNTSFEVSDSFGFVDIGGFTTSIADSFFVDNEVLEMEKTFWLDTSWSMEEWEDALDLEAELTLAESVSFFAGSLETETTASLETSFLYGEDELIEYKETGITDSYPISIIDTVLECDIIPPAWKDSYLPPKDQIQEEIEVGGSDIFHDSIFPEDDIVVDLSTNTHEDYFPVSESCAPGINTLWDVAYSIPFTVSPLTENILFEDSTLFHDSIIPEDTLEEIHAPIIIEDTVSFSGVFNQGGDVDFVHKDPFSTPSYLLVAYIIEAPEYGPDLYWGSFEYGTSEYEVRILSR